MSDRPRHQAVGPAGITSAENIGSTKVHQPGVATETDEAVPLEAEPGSAARGPAQSHEPATVEARVAADIPDDFSAVPSRQGLLLLAALATALSGACGGTSIDNGADHSGGAGSAGTTSMQADAFPTRYATAICALTDRCCNAAGGSQIEECEMDVKFQQGLDAANARSAGARFDAEAADACLSEIARGRCDADPLNLLGGYFPGCRSVWVGEVPLGEACQADLDCLLEGDASVSCIEGTCQTFEQLLPGSDCDPDSHTTVCAKAFATCDLQSLTCVPLPGDGQACTGECQLGYQCRARACLPEVGLPGSDCTRASECQSGLCVGDRCGSVLMGKYCSVPE